VVGKVVSERVIVSQFLISTRPRAVA